VRSNAPRGRGQRLARAPFPASLAATRAGLIPATSGLASLAVPGLAGGRSGEEHLAGGHEEMPENTEAGDREH